jgi:hypothetical protein
MGRHVVSMEYMINAYKILAGKRAGKKPLERYRCSWEIILECI